MSNWVSLNENYLFRRLYHRGKSKVDPVLITYCMRNGKRYNRVGITSSKKIGKAVARNRARRVIREAYRLCNQQYGSGYDLVFVARTKTTCVPMQQVLRAMQGHLAALTTGKTPVQPCKPTKNP